MPNQDHLPHYKTKSAKAKTIFLSYFVGSQKNSEKANSSGRKQKFIMAEPTFLRQKFGIQKRSSSLRLSSRTLNVYKEAFSAIDKKGEGSINKDQLKTVLDKLGLSLGILFFFLNS